ncbi:MAG: hypothetical protein PHY43_04140 [Verrucomicrobiales bacterium]|nr:hypothetical protein [Verrucomicrobiales bacterium]
MKLKKPAIHRTSKLAITALLPLALLAACSTSGPTTGGTPVAPGTLADNSGFGGEIVTDSISTTATVVSVDHAQRLVVLKRADGSSVTYKAAPGAFGFDDIKAGDEVKVSVAEEMAVFLGRNSVPASAAADTAKLRVKVPNRTEAVAAEVGVLVFTAKVAAINDWNDTVTLQLSDGSTKTIKVGEAVNLADVSVGDNVSVQSTEAAVILLEKP